MSSTAIGTFTCWDGYDGCEMVEERPSRPPRRSRLSSTSALPSSLRKGAERGGERQQTSKPATRQDPREQDYTSLDELWNTLRERKHAAEAKLPLKVKSLEAPQAGSSVVSRSTPEQHVTTPRKATPPKLKRKKSTYADHIASCVRYPDPSERVAGIAFHFASLVRVVRYVFFASRPRDNPFLSPHRSPQHLTCPA